jgi:16S rRNA (cytidine1402-2'-O)-methyltransferase
MPGVSDPGYRVVAAARRRHRAERAAGRRRHGGARGLRAPTDRFCFEGFPAGKAGERARRFAELAAERRTLVFETARRLRHLAGPAGRSAATGGAVCRELTKTHEEVRRGTPGELAAWAYQGVLGEVTVVVAGAPARPWPAATGAASKAADGSAAQPATAAAVAEVAARVRSGLRRNPAITAVARERGLPRGELYDAVASSRKVTRGSQPPP